MRRLIPALVFLVLSVAFLWRVTLAGEVLLPGDYLRQMQEKRPSAAIQSARQWDPIQWDALAQFYPWRAFYGRSVREGVLPLWNPYQFCGTPFAANGQSAVFYPLNLLYAVLSPEKALGWSAVLHLFLAGVFTFMLLRTLGTGALAAYIAGFTYTFGAFMITWLELPTIVNSAVWLPLALMLIMISAHSRRAACAAGAGIALAMSVLAGHMQIAMYVLIMALAWWFWLIASLGWRDFRARPPGRPTRAIRLAGLAALTFTVAFLLAAPQILPTLELSGLSHRAREVSAEGFARFQANAVPARNLITALVPDFYGSPAKGDYWGAVPYAEYALYAGVLPFMLAFLGGIYGLRSRLHVPFFAVAGILALLSAFGAHINAVLYYLIPGFSALGGPNRIIVLYALCVAVLAGIGADWFAGLCGWQEAPACERDFRGTFRPAMVAVASVGAVYAVSFVIAVSFLGEQDIVKTQDLLAHIRPELAIFAVLYLGGAALLLLRGAARISRKTFAALAGILVIADLFGFGIGYNPTCESSLVSADAPDAVRLRSIVRGERIMPLNSDWSLYRTPRAVLPPNLATLYGLYDVQGYDSLFTRRYKDFADAVQGEDSSPIENGNIVFFKKYSLSASSLARYVISYWPVPSENLRLLRSDDFYIYENPAALPFAWIPQGKVRITSRTPNSIKMDVSSRKTSALTVLQLFYPGWRAYIDGRPDIVSPSEIREPASGMVWRIFQSVRIPKGGHKVQLSFEPKSVRIGYWLAAAGIVLAMSAFIVPFLSRRWASRLAPPTGGPSGSIPRRVSE